MSQASEILAYLQAGHSLTPLEALDKFNCWRLGGRIHDLRKTPKGRDIQTEDLHLPNGKIVARYWLPQPKGQLDLWGNQFERSSDGVGYRAEGYN